MKRIFLRKALAVTLLATAIHSGAQITYRLGDNNQIYMVANEDDPPTITGPYSVSGIADGQFLVAMDRRPDDGDIYAFGYNYESGLGQLYYITNSSGNYVANAIGPAASGLNLTQNDNVSSFSFVPDVNNQIMLTDANNNSYAIDANDGNITDIGNTLVTEGLSANALGNDLLIYPNPVTSAARIVLPEPATHKVFVDLIDMNGRTVRSYEYGTGTYQLDMDMSIVPTGLYSVRVYQSGMPLENLKVVKN